MSAPRRTRSPRTGNQHRVSWVEALIVAPVVIVLAIGALQWQ